MGSSTLSAALKYWAAGNGNGTSGVGRVVVSPSTSSTVALGDTNDTLTFMFMDVLDDDDPLQLTA